MLAFFVSFAIGIIIWFVVIAYRSYSYQYFETFEDEVLVTSKFFKGATKCITAFYKGIFRLMPAHYLLWRDGKYEVN